VGLKKQNIFIHSYSLFVFLRVARQIDR